MSDTQLQLNSNELRAILDTMNEEDEELLSQQEHLACKIMLFGDEYARKILKSIMTNTDLIEEYTDLLCLLSSKKRCFNYDIVSRYIDNRDGKLKRIVVEGVTVIDGEYKRLIFDENFPWINVEKFSILNGRFFDKEKLIEFLKPRYKCDFTIVPEDDEIFCYRPSSY